MPSDLMGWLLLFVSLFQEASEGVGEVLLSQFLMGFLSMVLYCWR